MSKKPYIFIAFLLLTCTVLTAQRKSLQAISVTENITVDGVLDEEIWKTAPIGSDFIMFAPDNGKLVDDTKKTNVQVVYNDDAVYIAATLYDNEPNKILKEITQRDIFGTSEHFGVFINGYNDGQQDFRFFVSSSNVQMDCVFTDQQGEDFTWDAIWESKVKITDFGWVVEMKIPYAWLRFSEEPIQTWGINFYREFRRDRQQYTWNYIDSKIANESAQSGFLEGIQYIKPPTRLFFIPYSSLYYEDTYSGSDSKFKLGMDIKYGISDAFTLDAILVPDFGQTRFDNVILNLGPFEQQFNENRPFFTEGTELFNKGNLLYTRRIGGTPSTYPGTNLNEAVAEYPSAINLINAVKVSGRTKKGLGIGVLNAITERTDAVVLDTITGVKRKVEVEPLANYNVLVVDQRFNQNSSVALVNTNVTRNGDYRDANVTAAVFDLNTTKNTYNASGNFKYSYINELGDNPDYNGFSTALSLGETSGKYRYRVAGSYVSKQYDSNDLGINFLTNYHTAEAYGSYRILNPTKHYNAFTFYTDLYSEFQNTTGRLQQGNINLYVNSTSRKNHYLGYGVNIRPFKTYDFYEPQTEGRFVEYPENYRGWVYFSSNYNNRFALDVQPSMTMTSESERYTFDFFVSPRFRVNNSILLIYSYNYIYNKNNRGLIAFAGDDIVFARRDRDTHIHTFESKLAINNKMTVNLLARYYWSYAKNSAFENLQPDGTLAPSAYDLPKNVNFNSWNVDLSYSWWFAPGSQLSFLYRNNALSDTRNLGYIDKNFGDNFSRLLKDDLNNVFSVSIRYFIDYNKAKNWF
jgi:hypothetical protein